jgi:hypothetical protein
MASVRAFPVGTTSVAMLSVFRGVNIHEHRFHIIIEKSRASA